MGYVNIDNEVMDVNVNNYGYPTVVDGRIGGFWYLFQDHETAGVAAREYWESMAENDPQEFTCMVGEETLVKWALNRFAGPGSTQVRNLEEWLDLWLDTPEEQWGSYDGNCVEGTISKEVQEELGFDSKDVVFYRHN